MSEAESRHRVAFSLAVILLFLTVIIAMSLYGKSRRVYASGVTIITVDSPEEAYSVWNEKNVKGRILLLFGKYPHVKKSWDYEGVRELTASNFIELAAFNNIVRRMYFIIPDDNWEEIRQQGMFGSFRPVPGLERGLYLYNLAGTPIIATTPSSLPNLSETTMVYINGRRFDEAYVRDILSNKGIASDITVLYRGE